MLTYKAFYSEGYISSMHEIHLQFNGITIGCIYYLEDPLQYSEPQISFDKWRKYKDYEKDIPPFDYKQIANDVVMEYHLLS